MLGGRSVCAKRLTLLGIGQSPEGLFRSIRTIRMRLCLASQIESWNTPPSDELIPKFVGSIETEWIDEALAGNWYAPIRRRDY